MQQRRYGLIVVSFDVIHVVKEERQLETERVKCSQVIMLRNLRVQNMHAKSLPPTGARGGMELEYRDSARLQGNLKGPHTVTGGPKDPGPPQASGLRTW